MVQILKRITGTNTHGYSREGGKVRLGSNSVEFLSFVLSHLLLMDPDALLKPQARPGHRWQSWALKFAPLLILRFQSRKVTLGTELQLMKDLGPSKGTTTQPCSCCDLASDPSLMGH